MSTLKSSAEDLTINADGGSSDIKFQINAVEKASINSSGLLTSTTIDATALTGNLPAIDGSNLTGVGGDLSFGGDTFGADKTIGSNDTYSLSFETDGTERLKLHSDGRGLSQFTAKAWINLNGEGTIALRDSHNVSSVTDNGTGDYSVNFGVTAASADYSVAALCDGGGSERGANFVAYDQYATLTTSLFKLRTGYSSSGSADAGAEDQSHITAIVFGD